MNTENEYILIVEDEKNLGLTLSEYLNDKGHKCILVTNAAKAREWFYRHINKNFIILMDVGLPDGNGIELAKEFRSKKKDFVLLFLSAQNDPETRLKGLEIGGDDYITKPFALKELVLRLNKILEIRPYLEPAMVELGALKAWFNKYEVEDGNGNLIPLAHKENAILRLLYENLGLVVSRNQIIEKIWGDDSFPSNRTVDNYMVKLRKWCETDPLKKVQILSVRGIGYKLNLN